MSLAASSRATGSPNRNTASAFSAGSGPPGGTTFTSASSAGGRLVFQNGERLKGALVSPDLDGPPGKAWAQVFLTNHSAILGALKIFWSSGTGAGIRAFQSSPSPLA